VTLSRKVSAAVAVAALLAVSGCSGRAGTAGSDSGAATSSGGSTSTGTSSATSTESSAPASTTAQQPAALVVSPSDDAGSIRADAPVSVVVAHGTLRAVTLTSSNGSSSTVAGELDSAGTSWRNTDPLAPGRAYTLTVKAAGEDGVDVDKVQKFTTRSAASLVSSTLIPGDDWVVGVGMPVIVTFTQSVKNRAAAEAALTVTSTPQVAGSWRWMTSREVHWRPQQYWPAGTQVVVRAATSGVELAPGAWGRRTVTSTFTVGRSQISTVDVAAHTLTVTQDGATVRTIPVTTGMAGFRTRGGSKVVMEKLSQVRMDAATTGTDPKDPNYYNILVNWALRLTYSGEFLHAAPWSVGSQGRANVSHGCTGMSTSNAKWLYDFSQVGDVVVYKNSSRPLEWGNGYTEWNKSVDEWDATSD
jgi:lipoprotein-anchoring transpeptidase ErfK/SrfK